MSLEIKGLTKKFQNNIVIHHLDLNLNNNTIAAISGRSGTGKTTLFLCILGFLRPESGTIKLDDRDIINLPVRDRLIAYMPQDYGLFPHLDVAGNILFGLSVANISPATQKEHLRDLLAAVELDHKITHRSIDQISGGERQRVALARALAINPKLILIDEPLSAVDIETKHDVGRKLRQIIKNLNVPAIMITHDPADAKNISDELFELEEGKLKLIWKR